MENSEIRKEFKRISKRHFKVFDSEIPTEDPLTAIDHALRSIERHSLSEVVSHGPRHVLRRPVRNRSYR